jgi:hypothetical protein
MDKALRNVHLVLFTIGAVASIIVGVLTGLEWAGYAVGVLLGSRAARSALLLAQRELEAQDPHRILSSAARAHRIGYSLSGLLFGVSALRMETEWSGIAAAVLFAAAAMNLWLTRHARLGLSS